MSLSLKDKFRFIVFVSCILFLTGCTTYNSATGRNEFIMIATPQEITMGFDAHKQLQQKFVFSTDPKYINRVQSVGQKIALISDRQDYEYKFHVVEDKELNAFTTPGGNVYVNTGLLDKLQTDDELAFVIAHEVGHCAARHVVKKYQAALGYSVVGSLVLSQVSASASSLASMSSGVAMNLIFSSYGRKDEFEADRLGIKYMYLAGYDPAGAKKSFEVLKANAKGPEGPILFRSHPYINDRIKIIHNEAALAKYRYGKKSSKN